MRFSQLAKGTHVDLFLLRPEDYQDWPQVVGLSKASEVLFERFGTQAFENSCCYRTRSLVLQSQGLSRRRD